MPACCSSCIRAAGVLVLTVSASCFSHHPALTNRPDGSPVALAALGEHETLRWPSIAVRSDTIFVAGNVFSADSLMARTAYLGRVRQDKGGDLVSLAPLELPHGDFQFGYPRIASAGGKLHLVWAEFEPRPQSVTAWLALTNRPTSLWHAVLEHGGWSTPERIATAYRLGWNGETGGVAVDTSGTLHVAVWKGDIDSLPHVHDFRLAGSTWHDSSVPYTGLNQTTAIATRADTTFLAVVDEPRDTSRVMVMKSVDHGAHWTSPIVASWRPGRQGSVSRLVFAPTAHGLLLAIGEKANDSFYLDTIRVLLLKGGARPSRTQVIEPPPTVAGFVMAVAPCDSVVMLLRTFSLAPQLLELTLPGDSETRVIRPLLATARVAMFPGIAAGPRSAIAVFGYARSTGTPWRSVAMTLPACSP